MMKLYKNYIVVFLVAAVGASAIFCCCIERMAQVHAQSRVLVKSCCHDDKASGQVPAKPCPCSFKKFGIAETDAISVVADHLAHVVQVDGGGADLGSADQLALLNTAYGGAPPGSRYSVPLYLQHRSLRL